ncbi:MAG: hypothetical protein WBQ44_12380 [Rhodococcus sp. (in: high G+C Gram-positive bacteria)]
MPAIRRLSVFAAGPVVGVAFALAVCAPASALPAPGDFADVPSRTSLSFQHSPTGVHVGTANENTARPGLSTVKMYMADYALRHGDGSQSDRDLAERMIRSSDDGAASQLDAKYPQAIGAISSEFGLSATSRGGFWGSSYTSTADTVRFLESKKQTDPASPVLQWMNSATPIATDGTVQNWGTGVLAGATGTKWGWADDGSSVVASASIGDQFSVAANTYGSASTQTADVLGALGGADLTPPPLTAPPVFVPPVVALPVLPPLPTVDDLLRIIAPR